MIIHERLRMIMNVHERSRTIANDYERSRTFTKVREGSNEGSRIIMSGSNEWPEL